ncbi:MAG: hypothetical protein K8R88_05025 [Armatimonadetes bacterium]|nr:hypothetical protein [Armatimonadota bacterium]
MKLPKLGRKQKIFSRLIVICVAVGAFFMRDVIEANWNYNSVYAAAKAEGAIISADDLRKRYGATDEENAAPVLNRVMANLAKIPKDERDQLMDQVATLGLLWSSKPRAPLKSKSTLTPIEALEKIETTMVGIEACLSKPKCDFHYRWEDGPYLLLPQFTDMKLFARILTIRGRLLAQEGRTAESGAKFKLALHIGKLAGDAPILIAALVRIAIDALAFRQMSEAASEAPKDAALRIELRKALTGWGGPMDPRRAIAFELSDNWNLSSHILEYMKKGETMDDHSFWGRALIPAVYVPGVTRSWRMRSLQYCRVMNKILKNSLGDPLLAHGAALQSDQYFEEFQSGLSNLLSAIFMPDFTQAFSHLVQDIANREVLLASLDVLDERQKLGHWPATLPVDRRDPFGSGELCYRIDGEHARIWSIGIDHKDSEGKTKQEDKESDDLVVRL